MNTKAIVEHPKILLNDNSRKRLKKMASESGQGALVALLSLLYYCIENKII
jgi:hypothetical protein